MKKRKIILFAACGILLAALVYALIFMLLSSGFNDKYEITTDKNNYEQVITGEKWEMSEEIFPKSIDNLNVADFRHVYYDPWDANYLAYTVVDYGAEEYEKEVSRLRSYGIDKYKGFYGVTGFSDYELLAMEADSYQGFVYALTDLKSRIIYVELIFCNYYMDIDYEEQIPESYLPDGFNAKIDNDYQKKMMSK